MNLNMKHETKSSGLSEVQIGSGPLHVMLLPDHFSPPTVCTCTTRTDP